MSNFQNAVQALMTAMKTYMSNGLVTLDDADLEEVVLLAWKGKTGINTLTSCREAAACLFMDIGSNMDKESPEYGQNMMVPVRAACSMAKAAGVSLCDSIASQGQEAEEILSLIRTCETLFMKDWAVPLTYADLSSYLCKYPIEGVGFTHPLGHEIEEYGSHRLVDILGHNGDFRVQFKDGKGVVLSPCENFSVEFVRPSEFEDALTRIVDFVIKEDMDHRLACQLSAAERSTIEEEMSLTGLYGDRLRLYMKDHPLPPPFTLVHIEKDGLFASYLLDAEDAVTIPFIVEHAPVIEVQHNGEVVRLKLDGLRLETPDEAKIAEYKTIYGQRVSYSFIRVKGNFELFPLLNSLIFEKTKHIGLTDYSQTWKDQLKDFFSTDYDR